MLSGYILEGVQNIKNMQERKLPNANNSKRIRGV
jgi:hypothetical protein